MSNGSQTRWIFAQQPAYDDIADAADTWYRMRFNGGGPTRATSTEEDPEIGGTAASVTSEAAATGDFDVSLWYGMLDPMLEAMFGGTWTADVLDPGSTLRFFTFEESQPDLLAGNKFTQFVNTVPTSLSLTFPTPNGRVTGSLGISASNGADAATTAAGATVPIANTSPVIRTGALITDLELDGNALSTYNLRLQNLAVTFTRATEDEPQVDVQGRGGISYGDLICEIAMTAYDEERTVLNSLFNNISRGITFSCRDTNSKGYDFSFPASSPNGGEPSAPAKNTKRTQTLNYTCAAPQITRIP